MEQAPRDCPVEAALAAAFGKWKPIIIHHLLVGPLRFGELRRDIGGVTQRSLTLQLRQLENDGLIRREVFAEVPPKVVYSLTDFGRTLAPVIESMRVWGELLLERRA